MLFYNIGLKEWILQIIIVGLAIFTGVFAGVFFMKTINEKKDEE